MIALQPIDGWDEFQGQYINASYINVSSMEYQFYLTYMHRDTIPKASL